MVTLTLDVIKTRIKWVARKTTVISKVAATVHTYTRVKLSAKGVCWNNRVTDRLIFHVNSICAKSSIISALHSNQLWCYHVTAIKIGIVVKIIVVVSHGVCIECIEVVYAKHITVAIVVACHIGVYICVPVHICHVIIIHEWCHVIQFTNRAWCCESNLVSKRMTITFAVVVI